jgi:hypothetical protein
MRIVRSKGILERGAPSDLSRNTLSQIPSVFGRLVYLSNLRGANSGKYEHHGLALIFGEAEADKALRKTHKDTFQTWLNYNLAEQRADLDLYLSAVEGNRRSLIETWVRLTPYRNLIPASASEVEKQLYLSDFNALLRVLINEYGVSFPDQGA